jgi:hypothetical protein
MREPQHVYCNPDGDDDGLRTKKNWGPEKAGEAFRFHPEQVITKRLGQVFVLMMKAKMVDIRLACRWQIVDLRRIHDTPGGLGRTRSL